MTPPNDEPKRLPTALKDLVHQSVELLGQIIGQRLGAKVFERVESIRVRSKDATDTHLSQLHEQIKTFSKKERFELAHAFALLLELVNCCENAYRSHRLQSRKRVSFSADENILYVLTAHPTEARSSQMVQTFQNLQKALVRVLDGDALGWIEATELLNLAWQFPMSKLNAPTVKDEAEHLYALSLRQDLVETYIRLERQGVPFFLRSWVGGDKDGHPGVGPKEFVASLNLSRKHLLKFLSDELTRIDERLVLVGPASPKFRLLRSKLKPMKQQVGRIASVETGDGARVLKLSESIESYLSQYEKAMGCVTEEGARLRSFFKLFPGLVVPLEMRESAQVLQKRDPKSAIAGMLVRLRQISKEGNPLWYVRGLVISMTETSADLENAYLLANKSLGSAVLPIIPLFEKQSAIENAVSIVEGFLGLREVKKNLRKEWNHRFEVMLGYSDSAKEFGALPSRLKIEKAVHDLNRFFEGKKIRPVFFHGAGGSVARGGGSVKEQMSWWPKSALNPLKMTIQGEMIQRSFSSSEIFLRQIEKVIEQRTVAKTAVRMKPNKTLDAFSGRVQTYYQDTVASPEFLALVQRCTPYPFLSELKMGSRPAKRGSEFSVSSIRAIPWVLCWTQTRILMPAWWGIGTAWHATQKDDRVELRKIFQTTDVFSSYVKLLGFTLAKVRLPVWRFLISSSSLQADEKTSMIQKFESEYKHAVHFVHELTGQKDLVWFRPWLMESIRLRSNMIHPLNVLQKIALDTSDMGLLRETVAGISSGMLTTG